MKEMVLFPQLFDDPATYSVTCYNDGNFSAFSASPNSSVAKNTTVTLTVTPSTGKELDEIEVVAGGVTIEYGAASITFKMGEANVVLNAKGKKNNLYKVVENTYVCVNGTVTNLRRNMTLVKGKNGAITDVNCSGTALTVSADIIAALVNSGAIIKM